LVWLGFWQLGRAAEKTAQLARWEALSQQEWPLPGQPSEDQPVIIEGRYVPDRQWLLDNRTRGGRAGYEVLTLFQPSGSRPVVINRGWIPGTRDRARLPDVAVDAGPHSLQARIADWPVPPVIGEVARQDGWPRRVQTLTPDLASETSGEAVNKVFLRLADSEQPGALQADWAPSRMGASTHYGYAVQWFGLAIALMILGIVASFRQYRSTDSSHD
jgi:surfeit locus 1 family protein